MKPGLGTQLAHLLELLDSAVQASYTRAGLSMRPRYTPVFRALAEREPSTIGEISAAAGISQPAATQTIALMVKEGLISSTAGRTDARQRLIRLSAKGRRLLPELQACWAATGLAADGLDQDLPVPLSEVLARAIATLESRSFDQRIAVAREHLAKDRNPQ
jgi:DNA-binding MarR family transcriptional regulator